MEDATPERNRAQKFRRTLLWIFESFGSLLVFYFVEHAYGLVPAIITGVALSVAIVTFQIVREKKPSRMTIFSAVMVVLFGGLDLYFRSGFFIKLEPAIGNFISGSFFLATVLTGKPLITELAMQTRGELPERVQRYLRGLTLVWVAFFYLRAAVFMWLAYNATLDQALAVRGVLGPVSFGAMFVGEWIFRYLRFGRQAFADKTPPQR